MRQYTDAIQTAYLIALGFPTPKSVSKLTLDIDMDTIPTFNYSIGELIDMLPTHIFPNNVCFDLHICTNQYLWVVKYTAHFYEECYRFCSKELIDALYDMIVKLKEEGVL